LLKEQGTLVVRKWLNSRRGPWRSQLIKTLAINTYASIFLKMQKLTLS